MDEVTAKSVLTVAGFPVKVLGGTFLVKQLVVPHADHREDVLSRIHKTDADRWFVMVADNAGDEQDALALLDDDLEVRIYAHGMLRQD